MINVSNDEWSVFKIHRVEGPFAFVYWDCVRHKLWFGRDRLGRRSLLCGYNADTQCFALSAVPYKSKCIASTDWREIANSGLFCLNVPDGTLSHYSWRHILGHHKIQIDPHRNLKNQNDNSIDNGEEEKKDNVQRDESPLIYSKLTMHSVFQMNSKLSVSKVLSSVTYDQVQDAFINVLSNALRKRVLIPKSSKLLRHHYVLQKPQEWMDAVHWNRSNTNELKQQWKAQQEDGARSKEAAIGILYSGV